MSVYWIHLWPVAKLLQELEITFREHTIQRKTGTVSSLWLVLEERKEPLGRLLLMSHQPELGHMPMPMSKANTAEGKEFS